MLTRCIEKKNYIRSSVLEAELADIQETGVTLGTYAIGKKWDYVSSADMEMLNRRFKSQMGEKQIGTLQIDVCSDDVLRVRYCEGSEILVNETPMVTGSHTPPEKCEIDLIKRNDECDIVQIKTKKIEASIYLIPYRIEIIELATGNLIGVGGEEKNYFGFWDSLNTGLCHCSENERPVAVENFDLEPSECIYGLGEKFIRINKTGQTIDLNMIDGNGVTTPRSYKNIPFFMSTKGYGVYFNHSSRMTFWLGSMSAADIQVSIVDDFLDYYIFTGNIKEILQNYTQLTGKGVVPPKWTFGFWQSKISYKSAEETLEIAKKMREENIPCDVIHLDTHWFKDDWFCDLEFDKERFPDLEGYFREMDEMGINISLWQLPYIPEGSELFDSLKEVDGFVKDKDGNIYDLGLCFVRGFDGVVGVVDYSNPEAVKVHQDAFRKLFRLGAKVIKTDFGEAAPIDGVYYDGTPGYQMHNLYPLLYNKAIYEVTEEETGNGVVWGRSAWAGNQRYPICWGGDNSPNFHNMIPQIEGGLSLGLSGFQFWSQDIGGFVGETNDQLLIRWMQLGVFLSHSRIHGAGDREIYKFDEETMKICRDFIQLRYRLMPYIYSSAIDCVENSLPMARALVVEYQDDPNVYQISDQYMFGDSMMIAPIYNEQGKRRVYLPEGTWTCWWTHERLSGQQWIDVEVGIDRIPVYVREGAIIPMGPVMNHVDEIKIEEIELLISPFESEGKSEFNVPVNGESVQVRYEYKAGKHIVKTVQSDVKFTVKSLGPVRVCLSC